MLLAEGVAKRDITKRFACKVNTLHTLWRHHQMTSAGAGASEPLYFNDEGQPVYTYMVSVPHANKHLIRFPISLETYVTEEKGYTPGFFSVYTLCIAQGRYRSRRQPDHRRTFNQLFDSKC